MSSSIRNPNGYSRSAHQIYGLSASCTSSSHIQRFAGSLSLQHPASASGRIAIPFSRNPPVWPAGTSAPISLSDLAVRKISLQRYNNIRRANQTKSQRGSARMHSVTIAPACTGTTSTVAIPTSSKQNPVQKVDQAGQPGDVQDM